MLIINVVFLSASFVKLEVLPMIPALSSIKKKEEKRRRLELFDWLECGSSVTENCYIVNGLYLFVLIVMFDVGL